MHLPQHNPRRKALKTEFARELRREMTETERKRWSLLRRKQIAGLRFRRQQAIGPYVADFYCAAAKLVVELDGANISTPRISHTTERETGGWKQTDIVS